MLQRKDKEGVLGYCAETVGYEAVSWTEIELKPDHRHTGCEEENQGLASLLNLQAEK